MMQTRAKRGRARDKLAWPVSCNVAFSNTGIAAASWAHKCCACSVPELGDACLQASSSGKVLRVCQPTNRSRQVKSQCWRCLEGPPGVLAAQTQRNAHGRTSLIAFTPAREAADSTWQFAAHHPLSQEADEIQLAQDSKTSTAHHDSPGVNAAVSALKWYKRYISPLTPPSCRFLPTCSEYGMDAFKKFGAQKGFVLTAWRLLRCNPFGPSGYDPVQWPPPGLEWAFQASSAVSTTAPDSDSGPQKSTDQRKSR